MRDREIDKIMEKRAGCAWQAFVCGLIWLFCLFLCFIFTGCDVSKHVIDKSRVEQRDSISNSVLKFDNALTLTLRDTRESSRTGELERALNITFSPQGGTYNSKTGEASGVTGVSENSKKTMSESVLQQKDSALASLTAIVETQRDSISKLRRQNDVDTETKVEDSSSNWIVALLATFVFGFFTPFVLKKIPQTAWLLTWYR